MSRKKSSKRISLFDLRLSGAAKREVANVLASGWLSTGGKVAEFEKKLTKVLKVPHVAAVSSGTLALQLALQGSEVPAGAEVITSPFTFVATVEAILLAGAKPVLADIDPITLNISPHELEKKITGNTKAILPVDIGGLPADYDSLKSLCKAHSLKLVSDSAHSFGAAHRGKTMPQVADVSVYSFYPTKNVTCGEGGAAASRNKKIIDRVRLMSRHGLTSNAYQRQQISGWKYNVPVFGVKANLSDVHAAIGLGELTAFAAKQKKKEKLVKRYYKNLTEHSDRLTPPAQEKNKRHAWHLFIAQLNLATLKIDRNRFIDEMSRRGVECGVHYQPVFELSYYRKALNISARQFPNAAAAGQRVVSLPLYPTLGLSQVDYICECVVDILDRYRR